MPEKIVTVLENIAAVKGQDYVEGLVDMANILAPNVKPADKESEGKDNAYKARIKANLSGATRTQRQAVRPAPAKARAGKRCLRRAYGYGGRYELA